MHKQTSSNDTSSDGAAPQINYTPEQLSTALVQLTWNVVANGRLVREGHEAGLTQAQLLEVARHLLDTSDLPMSAAVDRLRDLLGVRRVVLEGPLIGTVLPEAGRPRRLQLLVDSVRRSVASPRAGAAVLDPVGLAHITGSVS